MSDSKTVSDIAFANWWENKYGNLKWISNIEKSEAKSIAFETWKECQWYCVKEIIKLFKSKKLSETDTKEALES